MASPAVIRTSPQQHSPEPSLLSDIAAPCADVYFPLSKPDGTPPLTDGRRVADTVGRWYVARTKPNYEEHFVQYLLHQSRYTDGAVGFLYPTYAITSRWANRQVKTFHKPLFQRNVFVCLRDDFTGDIDRHSLLSYPQQAIKVPDSVQPSLVDDLKRIETMILTDQARVEPFKGLSVGQRVRVTNGPMQGFQGDIVRLDNERRKLVVIISMLGQAVAYELEPHVEVEPVE